MPVPKLQRSVPLGAPIQWTDADLDALSQITPADIQAAKQLVKKASPLLEKLMNSEATNASPDQSAQR